MREFCWKRLRRNLPDQSETVPRMIPEWTRQTQNVSGSGYHSKFHQILRPPRKMTAELHQILHLPWKWLSCLILVTHETSSTPAVSNRSHPPSSPTMAPASVILLFFDSAILWLYYSLTLLFFYSGSTFLWLYYSFTQTLLFFDSNIILLKLYYSLTLLFFYPTFLWLYYSFTQTLLSFDSTILLLCDAVRISEVSKLNLLR